MHAGDPNAPAWTLDDVTRFAREGRPHVLVDVRSPEEFAEGHVPGAINLPLDRLDALIGELPRGAAVVAVCTKGGGRSQGAAERLRAAGFTDARHLAGGYLGYAAARTG